MKIKILNKSPHPLPAYETEHAAGMDLRAWVTEKVILKPMERMLIGTGLFMEIPVGYEAQVRPRSGMALKYGITVLNSPGTIDADYRGEVGVILINLSDKDFEIHDGDRIAQMIVARHERAEMISSSEINDTKRGSGGFGHSGKR